MKKLLLLLLLAGLAAAAWLFFKSGAGSEGPRVLAVAEVRRGDVIKTLPATGVVKPQVGAIVKIGSIATGIISGMKVKVGDKVTKGQLIATVDDRELQAKRRKAAADLEVLRAELAYAEKNLGRQRTLNTKDASARDNLDKVLSNVEILRHKIESLEMEIQTLDVKLSYTKIRSPINGVVGHVAAQEGEAILAGLEVVNLITVLDPTKLDMRIFLDEADVGKVKSGMGVVFRVDSYPDVRFSGRINHINPFPEIRNNIVYYHASVLLDSKLSQRLRPEMTTKCDIILGGKKDVLLVPKEAMKWEDGVSVVYVVDEDGAVSRLAPKFGMPGKGVVEVVSGLDEGRKVAVRIVLPEGGGKKTGLVSKELGGGRSSAPADPKKAKAVGGVGPENEKKTPDDAASAG